MNADRPRTFRRFTLVALVLPLVITGAAVVAQLLALPYVPATVAIHWGIDGAPNGFGPAWTLPALTVVVGFGIPALLAATCLPSLRGGDHGHTYRLVGATALGASTLMAILGTWSVVAQVGLDDPRDAPDVLGALFIAVAGAAVAGIAGWFLQPHDPWRATAPAAAATLDLARGEDVVWLQRTSMARAGLIVLGAALALLIVLTIVTARLSADPVVLWIMIGVTVLMAVLVAMTVAFHVRVDAAGLAVTSAAGWPRVHIPLGDVESAGAVVVNPMGEFGGWGLRWAPGGGLGVVLRSGPGIRVQRRSGKVFTVTVNDAETGAALLNALAARAR